MTASIKSMVTKLETIAELTASSEVRMIAQTMAQYIKQQDKPAEKKGTFGFEVPSGKASE